MNILLRSLPLLWIAAGMAAQIAPVPTEPRPPAFADQPFDGLFVDTPREDGTIWARGANYKAGFRATGVTYVPFFGPKNPSMPMRFELLGMTVGGEPRAMRAEASPHGDDARITFDRGVLVEQWDLQPRQAQQSFVLGTPPGAGDVVLEIAVTSTLAPATRDADGLSFAAPGLGSVHYGDAVVIDANGRRTPVPVQANGGGIRIHVPGALLAAAAFPVVIDPLVVARSFDTSAADSVGPDLCYDVTNDIWLLVNEEVVSSNDSDIRCRRFRPDGSLASDTFAESSSDLAREPSVANSKRHARFLVGWIQEVSIISTQVIVREHSSTTAGQSSPVVIHNNLQGIADIDIGGSTDATGLFLVTWTPLQVIFVVFRADVMCRTYAVGGVLGASTTLASQIGCGETVATSRTAGPGERWAVVWSEDASTSCLGGNLAFAIIASHGAVVQSRVSLDTTLLNNDSFGDVAGDGTTFLATWQRGSSAPRDIMGAVIGPGGGGSFAKLSATLNLTQLEPGAPLAGDQRGAKVEWDGCRFAYGYFEGTTPRPFVATLALDGITPIFYEGHLPCSTAASSVSFSSIAIASEGSSGGEPGICQAAWQQVGNGGRDLLGVVFDLRAPTGGVTRVLTHCPNQVASFTTIDAVGTPALGRTFSIDLGNVAGLPFLIAGTGLPTPLSLCSVGTGTCRQGVQLPALLTQFGSSLAVGVPCEVGLVGIALAFQGIDVGASGGCGGAVFGVPLRVTDTLVVRIM